MTARQLAPDPAGVARLFKALEAADAGEVTLGSVRVRQLELALPPWRGATSDSLAHDCRKGPALIRGSDGAMSCIEVEVARRLRAVQGWC